MSARHFLLGTLTGMVLAASAMYGWFETASSSAADEHADRTKASEIGSAAATVSQTAVRSPPTEPASLQASAASAVPDRPKAASSPPPAAPVLPGDRAVIQPADVPMTAEHTKMLVPNAANRQAITVPELHAQFASEAKDLSWALEAEGLIRQFLSHNLPPADYELMSVECRTSMCEVLAFGNTPTAQVRWNSAGAEMTKQEWWRDFRGAATMSSGQNGRMVIATILQRNQR